MPRSGPPHPASHCAQDVELSKGGSAGGVGGGVEGERKGRVLSLSTPAELQLCQHAA